MLEIHFLNVGHGDCTIIRFPSGRIAMVDINNSEALDEDTRMEIRESYSNNYNRGLLSSMLELEEEKSLEEKLVDPVEYFGEKFPNDDIFRFIATHPDMDHLSGLYRLWQEEISILNFWDTRHTFEKEDWESSRFDERDWETYQDLRNNKNGPTVLRLRRDGHGVYYNKDNEGGSGDGIYIIAPIEELEELANERGEPDLLSYVLMIIYGECKVIFGGDATEKVWENIYLSYRDEFLKSTLLKASHHGRDSGYYQPAVEAISPKYTIVSVGKKPDTDASNKYRYYSEKVYSTRYCGTIYAKCWSDGDIWLYDPSGERLE